MEVSAVDVVVVVVVVVVGAFGKKSAVALGYRLWVMESASKQQDILEVA